MLFRNKLLSSYSFTNINIGWPRSVHDARVLRNSRIYSLAERGELFPMMSVYQSCNVYPVVVVSPKTSSPDYIECMMSCKVLSSAL